MTPSPSQAPESVVPSASENPPQQHQQKNEDQGAIRKAPVEKASTSVLPESIPDDKMSQVLSALSLLDQRNLALQLNSQNQMFQHDGQQYYMVPQHKFWNTQPVPQLGTERGANV